MSHFNPKGKTMITETVKDHTYLLEGKGKGVFGQIVYTYTSPTHWSDALCTITVSFWGNHQDAEISFNYGAGGVHKHATNIEVAEALSEAFDLAAHRLRVLEECPWQAKPAIAS
jgi:hypothetical protein